MTDKITVSSEALRQARDIGLAGDVRKRLERMAYRSAPLTHELGNRRFEDFVLSIVDKQILAIHRL